MTVETSLCAARQALIGARAAIAEELRDYPTPVSGCDAQYNYLIGQRGSVNEALRVLEAPRFVATPRSPEPGAGIESR
ncbi:hypothetical protein [uncultured Roseobacter sp.]|uniref:hypothetical protein n=1 Tax=uncultured Roseobacter sp. TaxID=114847 RepID=UPI0026185CA2|nr:hypothetical protein [uncultured Roseobacter sp.]